MKKRTRTIVWLYIILNAFSFIAVLYYLLLAVMGFGFAIGLLKSAESEPWWSNTIGGLGIVGFAVLSMALPLASLLPWIYLLKKRAWAWWVLTLFFFAVSTIILTPLTSLANTSLTLESIKVSYSDSWPFLIVYAALIVISTGTLIILLTDYPSKWKKRRPSTTTKNRKRVYRRRRYKS